MGAFTRALLGTAGAIATLLLFAGAAGAQCPSRTETSLFGGYGYDGDEPDDYTHYVDANGDGICDFSGDANGNGTCDDPGCAAVVAWDAAAGVHPNGAYPDCKLVRYQVGTKRAQFILQIAHGHWEYTHLQSDTSGAPEEKDYLTVTQAMQTDFANGDSSGTATRASLDETLRFLTGEPERFERFLLTNPSGRYWQVDQWIGPGLTLPGSFLPAPLLTWTERFFACGDERGTFACAHVNGAPSFGGYWSDHAEQLGYQADCGDGELDDPAPELDQPVDPDGRAAECGILFVECSG
jgi:hypothetical protein